MTFTLYFRLGPHATADDVAIALRQVARDIGASGPAKISDLDRQDRRGRIHNGDGEVAGEWDAR